jgi:PAT family beta-lactamase induction signal transducer AmpG
MKRILDAYLNRRMAVLAALGFASGLPLALSSSTLQAWMTDAGLSLAALGLLGLVKAPYALKFAWSPVMDRFVPPILGRRRGWLLAAQVGLAVAILGLAAAGASGVAMSVAVAATAVAFASASQDIVADAYRTDLLPPVERGAGAAVFVTAWRVGFLVSGSAALIAVGNGWLSWPAAYGAMAGLMAVGALASVVGPEPATAADAPASLRDAVVEPIREFVTRRNGIVVLVFVLLFKLPDAMVDQMKVPFLQRGMGVPKETIGSIAQGLGLAASIVGGLAGGALVAQRGLWRSLWVFAILQAASNLGFWALTRTGAGYGPLSGVIVLENVCGGMVSAGFVAFLMGQCDSRYSATQFALLSSLMAVPRDFGGAFTGYLAGAVGWPTFFVLSAIVGLPGAMLLPFVREGGPTSAKREPFPANAPRGLQVPAASR